MAVGEGGAQENGCVEVRWRYSRPRAVYLLYPKLAQFYGREKCMKGNTTTSEQETCLILEGGCELPTALWRQIHTVPVLPFVSLSSCMQLNLQIPCVSASSAHPAVYHCSNVMCDQPVTTVAAASRNFDSSLSHFRVLGPGCSPQFRITGSYVHRAWYV